MEGVDVAIACCRRSDGGPPDDLYPDPDAAPLLKVLAAAGVTARLVSWDDPTADWAACSKVLVSSTWDSVDRPEQYLAWAGSVAEVTLLVNPVAVLSWNLDKVYLRDLEADGIGIIPTRWITPTDRGEAVPPQEYVVKPSISAGGRSTARYRGGDPAGGAHIEALQAVGQTVMVQGYLPAIDTDGETDLVFIDGQFSHAVGKRPALRLGQGLAERPWELMAWTGLTTPNARQFAVAERTMDAVQRRFGRPPVYGRVDLVPGTDADHLVLEVELIDPYLSLDMEGTGAARLVDALLRAR